MNKKGFTLIEILVVIAIIGMLSALALISFTSARARGRDARRLSDLRQMATALELYNNDQNSYPDADITLGDATHDCLNSDGFRAFAGCTDPYMLKVPTDPVAGTFYHYTGSSTSYVITATLEGTVNNFSGDVQVSPAGVTQR